MTEDVSRKDEWNGDVGLEGNTERLTVTEDGNLEKARINFKKLTKIKMIDAIDNKVLVQAVLRGLLKPGTNIDLMTKAILMRYSIMKKENNRAIWRKATIKSVLDTVLDDAKISRAKELS